MERALPFFLAVIGLTTIMYYFPKSNENFIGSKCGSVQKAEQEMVKQANKNTEDKAINPELAQAGIGSIDAMPPPATDLPLARVEQRAKGAPLPYRDPASEPAKYIRIKGMLEDLQAFLAFQAPNLQDMCDPAVQLPLTTARADAKRLQDTITVLDRNPGMQSRITNNQIRGIQDNLNYLRDELRKLDNSGAINEGFSGGSTDTKKVPATLQNLKEFNARVLIEKARIGASGTTDPAVQARISTLDRIDKDLQQIIQQVQGGQMAPEDIPIMKSDLEEAFPVLGDPTKPLPQQIVRAGLPPYIANLFPGGLASTDTATLQAVRDITKKYSDNPNTFTQTMARIFNLNDGKDSQQRDQRLLSMNNYQFGPSGSGSQTMSPPTIDQAFSTRGLPGANRENPEESGFDWKERARIIGERIRMRGLDPKDFGVIDPTQQVSKDFGWRGYAKMVCSRLLNTMDPGLPEYCGCPPYNWNGWTS